MFELACLLLALVWLYFWLSGHWFARVIAFLAMLGAAGVAGFVAFMVLPSKPGPWVVVSEEPMPPGFVLDPPKPSEGGPIVARLTDGTELQFPQGTADNVIDKAVSDYVAANKPREGKPWEKDPIVKPALHWPGTELHGLTDAEVGLPQPAPASRWTEYGGLALAGLLALLSWPLASIPIVYHRRPRSRQPGESHG